MLCYLKLEFAAAIWDPFQSNYKSDIESIQKKFFLFLLGDNVRRPPFRIAPYKERCQLVNLQTLNSRRILAKLMLGYDILRNFYDMAITEKINEVYNSRNLRTNRLLVKRCIDLTTLSGNQLHQRLDY